jgi:hypothetical protein
MFQVFFFDLGEVCTLVVGECTYRIIVFVKDIDFGNFFILEILFRSISLFF